MARPKSKQGFRPISIDGANYRWRVSVENRTADIEVHLDNDRVRGQRLCVYLAQPAPAETVGSEIEWVEGSAILPSLVGKIISDAISKGWDPKDKGRDFAMRLSPTVSLD